jgi:hypothetical protein
MKDFNSYTGSLTGKLNFLDATEDEIVDLLRSMLKELTIASSCLPQPAERKLSIGGAISSCEAYLNWRHPKQ